MSFRNIKTKGSMEGKADGSKQQEVGAALFPRLHVAETKKAGPRGPPRNKMALSEQLTIPSHKFKPSPIALPSSGRNTKYPSMCTPTYLPQVQTGSYDSMYSFVPMNYMNSGIIPTMACVPMMNSGLYSVDSRSSLNTCSSKSTVVDGSSEPSVGGAVTQPPKSFNHSKQHSPSKKGSRDDEFAVPAHSSGTPSSLLQTQQDSREEQLPPGCKNFVMEKRTSACVNQVRRIVTEKSIEVTSRKRKDDASWHTASEECTTVSAIDNDVDSQEFRHTELDRVPVGHRGHVKPSSCKIRQEDVRIHGNEDIISNISSENQSEEISELYQQKRGSSARTGSLMLENVPTDFVQLRDVVNIFGQQGFWKTQKVIIRQQRIFSKQLFDLHRIMEVQHLLAKELCFSITVDEDKAPPYATNPWAPRMASPYVYVPYPPTCSPGYGAYPMMGASVPVYGHPGAMPVFRFPAWPLPGMSHPWNARDSVEAAAWYGQQAVPGAPPVPSKGFSSPACNMEHFASSSGSRQSVERTAQMGNDRSAGKMSDTGANRSNEGDFVEGCDRAKVGGGGEVRVRGDRNSAQKTGDIADLRGEETDCEDGAACQDAEAGQENSDCEVKNHSNERNKGNSKEGAELESMGRQQKGSSNGKSLKRMRSESLDPDACRWFPILSPAKVSKHQIGVIKAVPRAVSATLESAANILLSIQTEKWR
uniref:Uncharacterized protein n=2 Tax=Physcomitrium patens TaxID=3218 RepID=A0A7I4E496_PHYPA